MLSLHLRHKSQAATGNIAFRLAIPFRVASVPKFHSSHLVKDKKKNISVNWGSRMLFQTCLVVRQSLMAWSASSLSLLHLQHRVSVVRCCLLLSSFMKSLLDERSHIKNRTFSATCNFQTWGHRKISLCLVLFLRTSYADLIENLPSLE